MIEVITFSLVGLIALLAILLVCEVSKQNNPSFYRKQQRKRYQRIPVILHKHETRSRPRYQRIPVIPPKRHSPDPPPAPLAVPPPIIEPPAPPTPPPAFSGLSLSNFKLPNFSQTKRTLPAHHPLRIKLMAMVGGDVKTADRLLQQCQKNNPGMDLEWYFDKVIYDLIRDRR
jgi:hypothetical protein